MADLHSILRNIYFSYDLIFLANSLILTFFIVYGMFSANFLFNLDSQHYANPKSAVLVSRFEIADYLADYHPFMKINVTWLKFKRFVFRCS